MNEDDLTYSDSYSHRALAAAFTHKLDEKIRASISNLIAADAAKHDKIAGQIMGLQQAKQVIEDLARIYVQQEQPSLKLVSIGETGPKVDWGL